MQAAPKQVGLHDSPVQDLFNSLSSCQQCSRQRLLAAKALPASKHMAACCHNCEQATVGLGWVSILQSCITDGVRYALCHMRAQVSSSKPTCTGSSSSSSQAQAAGDIKQAPSQLLSLTSGQQDTMSVDALYQFIGQPRDQPTATLNHQQAQQVQQLYSKQLQDAAAAETATVGSWQQLPHERLPDATAKVCVRKPGGSNSKSPTGRTTTAVLDVDSEAGCVDVRGTSSRGGSAAQAHSSSHLPVTYRDGQGQPTGTAGAQQQQQPGVPLQTPEDAVQDRGQLGQQQAPRSAAMHHAAIMHFAALRAAAGGQPLS
jgi:hypothetical protein